MKKLYYLIFIIGSLLFTVSSCEIDNYPLPDAKVYGSILDSQGGGLVETDVNSSTGSTIGVYELGQFADNPVRKTWLIKQNGEYRNNLVFSNDYRFDFTSCNFFPFTQEETIKPGDNKIDFTVVPFIRIKNLSITHDAANNLIVATFNLEPGSADVRLARVRLYSWSDMYVGEYVKKSLNRGTGTSVSQGVPTISFPAGTEVDPAVTHTITIDLAANQATTRNGFGVHRNYYFRVGALATGLDDVGTIKYNYAPYIVIPL